MKKHVTKKVEVVTCDFCGKEIAFPDCHYDCRNCGKSACFECHGEHMIDYYAGVFFMGAGDSHYCHKCDKKLIVESQDPLYRAYRRIAELKVEHDRFYEAFKKRQAAAEAEVKRLYKE